jgi:hypothetical protein
MSEEQSQSWLVNGDGDCIALAVDELELPQQPYRLYRFLTELEDILDTVADDHDRIRAIAPSGLSSFYLWVKTLKTDTSICRCELPIYRLL